VVIIKILPASTARYTTTTTTTKEEKLLHLSYNFSVFNRFTALWPEEGDFPYSKHWFTTSFLWRRVTESDVWSVGISLTE